MNTSWDIVKNGSAPTEAVGAVARFMGPKYHGLILCKLSGLHKIEV